MQFKVGDKAVYPGHGLGKITSIETKEILGATQKFYSLLLTSSDMKIMVPENQVKVVGLRSIITRKTADTVLEILQDRDTDYSLVRTGKNWSKRYQEYMKIIKTGNIVRTAQVFRELLNIEEKKGLSFYERQLMLTICKMIFDEISMIISVNELQKTFDFVGILANLKQ
ncbi:MAG: CarD family transcriptional regulator [Bdellovibrionales bacterium]|nr:CarD family transcriptional regulator [Bdellovibrionales bacterium]